MTYEEGRTAESDARAWCRFSVLTAATDSSHRRLTRRPRRHSADPAARRAKPRLEIYGFAMLDMGYQTSSRTTRTGSTHAADQAAGVRGRVRRGRRTVRRRSPEPLRRQGRRPPTSASSRPVRVRAVRRRRRRGPDDVPAAPRLRRLGAVRRRPDLEPVHGHRRVPELDRVLGTERHGVLPQRAGALDADPAATRSFTSRSSGPARAPTGAIYADRIELQNVRAASRCPISPAGYRMGGDWGYVEARGHPPQHQLGRPARRRRSTSRATRRGWGSTSARTSSSAERRRHPAAGRLRRGHPELHERRARWTSASSTTRQPASRRSTARRCRSSASSRSSTTTGTRSGRARSATRCVDIDNSDGQARRRVSRRASTRSANLLYYPMPNVMLGASSSGAGGRTSATASPRDDFRVQFSFKYSF